MRSPLLASFLLALLLNAGAPFLLAQTTQFRSRSPLATEADRDQRLNREQWFRRGRTIPGVPAAALRYRAYLQKMQMRAARRNLLPGNIHSASSAGTAWSPLGPAPAASDASGQGIEDYSWVSGRTTAVAVDPADKTGNTVYAGGAYGGLWRSQNAACGSYGNAGCVTWTPLIDNQPTLAVGAIAIQPGGSPPLSNVIVVGTGEADSSLDSYYGLGILQSANGGATWTLIASDTTGTRSFAGLAFSKIAFSASSPNLAVAAAAGSTEGIIEGLENPITSNLGLYYSTNSGAAWAFANVQDSGVGASPSSGSSVVYNAAAGVFFAALRYHGFYSSSDGINWSRIANQPGAGLTAAACPPQIVSPSDCPIYRGEISVVPGRNEMYVWYVDVNDNDQGIWKSTDGGNSWIQMNESGITSCGDEFGCGAEQGTYNLELAALPNGTATDLYAGAINIYKCTVSSVVPDCSGTGVNTFLNLTHVYGCPPDFGSIAHVHPAQHAISYLLTNGNSQDVMYFANDGGIYRALDGYTGLTSGTCGTPNEFDSLNQTLGSMTQVVAFSQSATDPDVVLSGTQGNGAPATALALIPGPWSNVDAGDNGYTLIDPTNEENLFVSTPPDSVSGVNIFNCANGIGQVGSDANNCHTQDFQNNQVVSSADVGGDTGPYYPPYILDPQNASELLVGTCRMWRGAKTGGAFNVLSHSFETGGDDICTGSEINLVRSVAAGGALDNNGFSNVMYVGTDGYGPLIPTTPGGGHVWVSTNVAGGLATWIDQTGAINPNAFPISGTAMDSSDRSGLTAYVGIMGFSTTAFPTSHVWQTTDGGNSWTDITGNLPDAPANAVLVDPGTTPLNGTLYVGTDVGVFASSTATPNWTEVGPAPGSGQSGYLPDAPVTALEMFSTSTTKLLRASTYGRGVWQFPLITTPDFVLALSPNTMTVFGGQQATFNGKAISLWGYNNSVNLSCISGNTKLPPTCSAVPANLLPTGSGTPFTVTAAGPDGDYAFQVQGVGTDPNSITHDFSLTLHVVDYALTAPSPASVTADEPSASPPVQFQVTAAGAFSGTVTLSCLGLPDGAGCNFQPSSSVNPTSSNPVRVTLTISTGTNTPTGTFPLTIQGTTPGGPDETPPQNLSLTVANVAGYSLALDESQPATASADGGLATLKGTLTSLHGYNNSVNLSCGAGATSPPPTCVPNPASLTPTTSGAAFTLTVKSSLAQAYKFNLMAVGTDASAIKHEAAATFTSTFDFSLSTTSSPQSIAAGQNATYDLNVTPYGSNFPAAVTLSCSGLPTGSNCAFQPQQVAAGSGVTPVTLTIGTTAPVLSLGTPSGQGPSLLYALVLSLVGLLFFNVSAPKMRQRCPARKASLGFSLLLTVLLASCAGTSNGGSSGNPQSGTTPGTYLITVTAVSGSLTRTTPVTLTIN